MIYLGLSHPASGLLAEHPAKRAQNIRGLVYITANCYAGIGVLDFPDRWYPDPDEAVKEAMQTRGRRRLYELWENFADQFPFSPWLSGERLGALDILAATVSRWRGARRAMAVSRPEFAALLARVDEDPRIASVWARHCLPLVALMSRCMGACSSIYTNPSVQPQDVAPRVDQFAVSTNSLIVPLAI